MQKTVLDPEQSTEFMAEISSNTRFINVEESLFILKQPTERIVSSGRLVYAKTLTTLLKEGVPSRSEMRTLLIKKIKDAGKDPAILDARAGLMERIAKALQTELPAGSAENLVTNIGSLSTLVTQAFSRLSAEDQHLCAQLADHEELEAALMSNCAEAIAATERDLFILSECVFKETGEPLWASHSDMAQETRLAFVQTISEEFQRFVLGLPLLFELADPSQVVLPNESPDSSPL